MGAQHTSDEPGFSPARCSISDAAELSFPSPYHHTGCPTLLDLLSSYLPGTSLAINSRRMMSILLILVQLSFLMLTVIGFVEGLVWCKILKPSTRAILTWSLIDTKNSVVFIPSFDFPRLTLTSSDIWRPKVSNLSNSDGRSYFPGVGAAPCLSAWVLTCYEKNIRAQWHVPEGTTTSRQDDLFHTTFRDSLPRRFGCKRWLVGWLVGWRNCLVGWLVDWLIGWLVDWLVGWLVCWLVGWLVGGSAVLFLQTSLKTPLKRSEESVKTSPKCQTEVWRTSRSANLKALLAMKRAVTQRNHIGHWKIPVEKLHSQYRKHSFC